MKKVLKYINNNIVELVAIRDTVILVALLYGAAQACKFLILYLA